MNNNNNNNSNHNTLKEDLRFMNSHYMLQPKPIILRDSPDFWIYHPAESHKNLFRN